MASNVDTNSAGASSAGTSYSSNAKNFNRVTAVIKEETKLVEDYSDQRAAGQNNLQPV